MMKRRTLVLGGVVTLSGAAVGTVSLWPRGHAAAAGPSFAWKGNEFKAGGTAGINVDSLPKPMFRSRPNCVVAAAQTLGPCHVNDVPVRGDVTEGQTGLPVRLAWRIVNAPDCQPIDNADIEIWHADSRGIYSGRDAAKMCTGDDPIAVQGKAFRGRQVTNRDGVAEMMTAYPGWYVGRAPHIHCRIVVDGQELLVSQIYMPDALNDIVYRQHADYRARPDGYTRNGEDGIFPSKDSVDYIFDVEKLEGGVLSASITIGVQTS